MPLLESALSALDTLTKVCHSLSIHQSINQLARLVALHSNPLCATVCIVPALTDASQSNQCLQSSFFRVHGGVHIYVGGHHGGKEYEESSCSCQGDT